MAFRGAVIDTAVVKELEQVIERAAVLMAKCNVVCGVCLSVFSPASISEVTEQC